MKFYKKLIKFKWLLFRMAISLYINTIYTQFIPSSSRVDTAIWMHYMDAN